MPETTYRKTTCERCGEHIDYLPQMAGQSTQCPACQHTVKLVSPAPPPRPPKTTERASGRIRGVRLYWIKKQGDSEATGPFTFPQVQGLWRAGTVKVTDTIRRDGKNEWHSVGELQRDLDSGGGQLTTGQIVGGNRGCFPDSWILGDVQHTSFALGASHPSRCLANAVNGFQIRCFTTQAM